MDLDRGTLTVRQGKGDKDRVTVLPHSLREAVARQMYLHVAVGTNGLGVVSPLDRMG